MPDQFIPNNPGQPGGFQLPPNPVNPPTGGPPVLGAPAAQPTGTPNMPPQQALPPNQQQPLPQGLQTHQPPVVDANALQSLEQQVSHLLQGPDSRPLTEQSQYGGQIIHGAENEHQADQFAQTAGTQLALQLEQAQLQNAQLMQQMQQSQAQQNQLVTQQMQAMQTQQQQTQQPPQLTPEQQFALSQEELEAAQDVLPAIDKRSQQHISQQGQQLMSEFEQKLQAQNTALEEQIKALGAQVTLAQQATGSGYQAIMQADARSFNLDPNTLPGDPRWQQFLAQPASKFSSQTLQDVVSKAQASHDNATIATVFKEFSASINPQPGSLTGLPSQGGAQGQQVLGQPPQDAGQDHRVAIENQRTLIKNQMEQSHQLMNDRLIDADTYRNTMYKLQNMDAQLIDRLMQPQMAA